MSHQRADSIRPGGTSEGSSGSNKLKIALYVLAALAVVALLVWGWQADLGTSLKGYLVQFSQWIDGLGPWAPAVFIAGYAVATVAFFPGSVLTAAGGILFGLLWGTVYVFIGATIGACLAFLIARYVARGWVERKLADEPRFRQVDRAVGREGGKITALLRLSPLIPFNLLNYALGLTNVRFVHYLWACLAMLPGTFLYVFYGKAAGDIAAAAAGDRDKTVWDWVFIGAGLLATLVATWIITKKARQALSEQTDVEVEA